MEDPAKGWDYVAWLQAIDSGCERLLINLQKLAQLLAMPVDASIAVLWFGWILHPRFSRKKNILIQLCGTAVIFGGVFLLLQGIQRLAVSYLLFFLLIVWGYLDPLPRKLLSCLLFFFGSLFSDLIVTSVIIHIAQVKEGEIIAMNPRYFAFLFSYYAIFILYLILVAQFLRSNLMKIPLSELTGQIFFTICDVCMLILVISCAVQLDSPDSYLLSSVTAGCAFCGAVFQFRTMRASKSAAQAKAENQILENQQKMQLEHYQALNKQIQETRKFHHDISNQVQTIEALLRRGLYQDAADCCEQVRAVFDGIPQTLYCEHPAVNALLYNKIQEAEAEGIRTEASVALPADVPFPSVDLIRLLSNLLDNALEACRRVDGERVIQIGSRYDKASGTLTIKVCNSKSPAQTVLPGMGTSKPDSRSHGYGTQIVEDIARCYDGSARFHDGSDMFTTVVQLRAVIAGAYP